MRIRWNSLIDFEKQKFEKMNETDRFVYFLCKVYGSPYGWGKENPETSDCSGAVCMALYAATGLLIRTTADDLYQRVFTMYNPKSSEIRAMFCLTKKDIKHVDRMAAAGTATHVAGFLNDGVILNSEEPYAKIRRLTDVSDQYQRSGHDVVIRGLTREALARLAAEKAVYDLDKDFHKYFEIGV